MRYAKLALLVTVLLAGVVPAQAAPGRGSSAVVGAEWTCEGEVRAWSENHAISNIVVVFEGGEQKIEEPFQGGEVFEYTFEAADYPGLEGVHVKAGNNGTRGKGEYVALTEPDCDQDADGFTVTGGDCDDSDDTVFPGAPETPNDGIDQDCDGSDLVVGDGDVRVTLQWESNPPETVDMDLYVIDPNGYRLFWAQRSVPSGGQLDRDDDVCHLPDDGQSIENAFWPAGSAPSGIYTVGVDEYSRCSGASGPARWTLNVYVGGVLILSQSGVGDDDPARESAGPSNTFQFAVA